MPTTVDTLRIEAPGFAITRGQEQQLAESRQKATTWLKILHATFGHAAYLIDARNERDDPVGHLALSAVESRLFGRFLVSLPYLNTAGVETPFPVISELLVERAAQLADDLDVNYLELRHENAIDSPRFNAQAGEKIHMRLPLPPDCTTLWDQLKPKVRNQVRKGEKHGLTIEFGRSDDHVRDFYRVFSTNMRDLGTPVYPRRLFEEILSQLTEAELAIAYLPSGEPAAAAYLQHAQCSTSVPSASSLRRHNQTNANMWMYWQLLCRAIEQQSVVFDFGRSTIGEGTYRFKKQWGACPSPANWQYYRRIGSEKIARPSNPKYQLLIRIWKKLPLPIANFLGPKVVRGIP